MTMYINVNVCDYMKLTDDFDTSLNLFKIMIQNLTIWTAVPLL